MAWLLHVVTLQHPRLAKFQVQQNLVSLSRQELFHSSARGWILSTVVDWPCAEIQAQNHTCLVTSVGCPGGSKPIWRETFDQIYPGPKPI